MSVKKKSEFAKYPAVDKTILIIGYIILGLFIVAIILPMVYIILASFIDPVTLQNSGLTFDFSKWTLTAYERVMSNAQIWVGFRNALIYSVLFTIISVVVTLLAAYPMSRADFKGRSFFNTIFVITMFSGGELIIDGKVMNDVAPKDRDIAMVFQNYALYPHMTVYDNMAFSLKLRKEPKDVIDKNLEF